MPVLKEWRCLAHGAFEGFEQKCPHGCSAAFIRQEIRTPPAIKSNGTKVADASIRALAADFGLTDVKNDKEGGSVMECLRKGENFAPRFMDVPHAAPGFSRDPNARVPTFDPQAGIGGSTAQGENAAARAFGMTEDGRVKGIPRPRPMIDPKLVYRPSELPEPPP